MIFVPVSIYQPYTCRPFTYHMCKYLVQITVVSCDAQPPKVANYFKMFYVVVIILRGSFQTLLIKYNHNTMVEIDQCIYRVLDWKCLVYYQRTTPIQIRNHVNITHFFTFLNQIIANNMLPLILHLPSFWLNWLKKKIFMSSLITIWENTNISTKQYIYDSAL